MDDAQEWRGGTKHVFAGTSRVVSKLVKQDKANSKRKGRIVYEKDQYYYHPDHLGTTAYITHTNGQIYQHLEYFPFGETWVEEHSNKQRTPYLFTAKELDEETGLYYFGARYYDPRTSVWQSTDPLLQKFIPQRQGNKPIEPRDLPGLGGVYNSMNIAVYGYAQNNPLKLIDPDGERTIIAVTTVEAGTARANTQPGGAGKTVTIPTYKVQVVNPAVPDNQGLVAEFQFTRDSTKGGVNAVPRGEYGKGGEVPPGVYKGFVRQDKNRIRLQLFDPSISTPAEGKLPNPDDASDPRTVIQFHGMGCSEGCLMSESAGYFNALVKGLQEWDKKEGRDPSIDVLILDRNNAAETKDQDQ